MTRERRTFSSEFKLQMIKLYENDTLKQAALIMRRK
ncbi:transposase [Staphylococcus argenteus]|nr:transposase [Staphylococcus argenteus]CDR64445.1 transposase [Staphylococcus argenteus]SGX07681.1 transposase [Staphylococcus argenteus]SGX28266.1 transposase [Staphylococcus argenteus]SGX29223.1 transposase [Staphylococcus argenteus]